MISALWYDLELELQKFFKENGFEENYVTVEPDLINASVLKPVIFFDWLGNSGGDIDDDEFRLDRDKTVKIGIFVEQVKSNRKLNTNSETKVNYELHNKILNALFEWSNTIDHVNYPLSDKINRGSTNMTPSTFKARDESVREGTGIIIEFHYKLR